MKIATIINSPDCPELDDLTSYTEELLRGIEGIIDVSGDNYGSALGNTGRAVVVLDEKYRGKRREFEIRTKVEEILGPNVEYIWIKKEDGS
jgi:hypothetical protein